MRRLCDGERDVIRECERDARPGRGEYGLSAEELEQMWQEAMGGAPPAPLPTETEVAAMAAHYGLDEIPF